MWQVIIVGSLVTWLLRILPTISRSIYKLHSYPLANRFLDYTICLVMGEIIYSIAFGSLPVGDHRQMMIEVISTILAMITAICWMLYTGKVTTSFTLGFLSYILFYSLISLFWSY